MQDYKEAVILSQSTKALKILSKLPIDIVEYIIGFIRGPQDRMQVYEDGQWRYGHWFRDNIWYLLPQITKPSSLHNDTIIIKDSNRIPQKHSLTINLDLVEQYQEPQLKQKRQKYCRKSTKRQERGNKIHGKPISRTIITHSEKCTHCLEHEYDNSCGYPCMYCDNNRSHPSCDVCGGTQIESYEIFKPILSRKPTK